MGNYYLSNVYQIVAVKYCLSFFEGCSIDVTRKKTMKKSTEKSEENSRIFSIFFIPLRTEIKEAK